MKAVERAFPIIVILLLQMLLLGVLNEAIVMYSGGWLPVPRPMSYVIPVNVMIVLGSVITVVVAKMVLERAQWEIESKLELQNVANLLELIQTMRVQRHSFNHHLQTVHGLLEVGAFEEARNYLSQSVEQVIQMNELMMVDNPSVSALLQVKRNSAAARGVRIHVEVSGALKSVAVSTQDINVVLGNLIDNAVEAVECCPMEQRWVRVIIEEKPNAYGISVINGGPPISPNVTNNLFRPGFSTKGQGRGMGLYSVKQILDRVGGSIKVAQGLVDGTTFIVSLPKTRPPERERA